MAPSDETDQEMPTCPTCRKTFRTDMGLLGHQRVHKGASTQDGGSVTMKNPVRLTAPARGYVSVEKADEPEAEADPTPVPFKGPWADKIRAEGEAEAARFGKPTGLAFEFEGRQVEIRYGGRRGYFFGKDPRGSFIAVPPGTVESSEIVLLLEGKTPPAKAEEAEEQEEPEEETLPTVKAGDAIHVDGRTHFRAKVAQDGSVTFPWEPVGPEECLELKSGDRFWVEGSVLVFVASQGNGTSPHPAPSEEQEVGESDGEERKKKRPGLMKRLLTHGPGEILK